MTLDKETAKLQEMCRDLEERLKQKEIEIEYYKKIAEETGKNCIRQTSELSEMIYERNRAMKEREDLLLKERQLTEDLNNFNKSLGVLASIDSLTGIFNRRTLLDTLEQEILRAKRYSLSFGIIIFDIDYFKKINDSYGHPAGDKVLKIICDILKMHIRINDILGRYGGEEFLILLPEAELEHTMSAAEKVRTLLSDTPIPYDSSRLRITASFGVTCYRENDDIKSIIARADGALYESKKNGRNRITVA